MKTIRCKFVCSQVAHSVAGTQKSESISLHAVSGPENEPWSKWTPTGAFSMNVTNPDAFGAFEPGKSYFLDITPAE